ncbi:hypothetical protein IW262DRAFT_987996 [Armillaria fumosa]|nr:hypothetical protein IW262DRAFT_987996 [Armillaria fumosa]
MSFGFPFHYNERITRQLFTQPAPSRRGRKIPADFEPCSMDVKRIDPELIFTVISTWGSPLSIVAVVFLIWRLFICPFIPPFAPSRILSEDECMSDELMLLFKDHFEELADTGLYSHFTILRNRRCILGQRIQDANEEAGLSSLYTYVMSMVQYWKECKQCRQELKELRRKILNIIDGDRHGNPRPRGTSWMHRRNHANLVGTARRRIRA